MSTASGRAVHPPSLITIQVLRGIAATLVLLGHARGTLAEHTAKAGWPAVTVPGFPSGSGVDLFFCISGFIMAVSSTPFFQAPGGWKIFLERRFVRLVPLYWLFTLIYLPLYLLGSHRGSGSVGLDLLTSLAFFPYSADGSTGPVVYPLYSLGWSLNYEMFFYLIFATFLFLPARAAIIATLVCLSAVVVAGLLFDPRAAALAFWSAPILLEFGFGLIAGFLWLSRMQLPRWICLVLAVLAVWMLGADPLHVMNQRADGITPDDLRRVVGWGLPAVFLITSATFLEKRMRLRGRVVAFFKTLGDASYSIYLVHPLVLLVLIKLWMKLFAHPALHTAGSWWPLWMLCALIFPLYVAVLISRHVERPMTRHLNRLLGSRRPKVAAA